MFKSLCRVSIGILILSLFVVQPAYAFSDNYQQSFTLRLVHETKDVVDKSLIDLKKTGANFVTITPGWVTDNLLSSNVDRKARTPTDAELTYAITKAHALGMGVMIKPHIDPKTGNWRAFWNPTDKATAFANYKKMILGYAQLAETNKVEQMALGAELWAMTSNTANEAYWRDIIKDVRPVYTGKLTYGSNYSDGFDETSKVPFWNDLDYVGVQLYMGLAPKGTTNPTKESIKAAWKTIEAKLAVIQSNTQKSFIVTEIGYRSADGAAADPSNYKSDTKVDLQEQVDLYNALFEFWSTKSYLAGLHIWDWELGSNPGGPTANTYTVQNKPAYAVVSSYYSLDDGATVTPTPTPTPTVTPVVTLTPTPTPTPTITPEVTPTLTPITTPEPTITLTPTATPIVSTGEIVIDNPPTNNYTISGEKKLKIYIKNIDPIKYTATYQVDDKAPVTMDNSGSYKQSKVNFDTWNWKGNGPYIIEFVARNLDGTVLDNIKTTLFVKH